MSTPVRGISAGACSRGTPINETAAMAIDRPKRMLPQGPSKQRAKDAIP